MALRLEASTCPGGKRRLHAWSPASGAPSARGEAADSPAEANGVSSRVSQHCVKAAGPEPTTVISCPVKLRGRPKHREDVGALLLQAHRRKPTQTFPGVLRSSDLHRQLGVVLKGPEPRTHWVLINSLRPQAPHRDPREGLETGQLAGPPVWVCRSLGALSEETIFLWKRKTSHPCCFAW